MSHAMPTSIIPLTKTPPWPHQERAFAFASSKTGTMLALDMGCGKSKVAIDLIQGYSWSPVLILCPKSVVSVWPLEFGRHAVHAQRVVALNSGSVRKRSDQVLFELSLSLAQQLPLIIIINYEAAILEPLRSQLLAVKWTAVILDESHRIKAPGGKQSWLCTRLRDQALNRLCLTGTPMPHSPLDLYAQYRFLDPSIFGTSFVRFRARYSVMGGYKGKQVVGWQNTEELETLMKRIMFRVKSDDVQSLPETMDLVRTFQLKPATMKLYQSLRDEFCLQLEQGVVTAGNALTRLLRLQQLTSGYTKTDSEIKTGNPGKEVPIDQGKQDLLKDVLEDIATDEAVVIFCRFKRDIAAVHEVAMSLKRESCELSGQYDQLESWQQEEAPILAVQIQSGGVGIDLTRARYAIYYSLGFSLGDYLQSRKRVHRPGQTKPVTYIHLIAEKTVDEVVLKALQERQDVINRILEKGL